MYHAHDIHLLDLHVNLLLCILYVNWNLNTGLEFGTHVPAPVNLDSNPIC